MTICVFFGFKLPFRGILHCVYTFLYMYACEPIWLLVTHTFREPSNLKNKAIFLGNYSGKPSANNYGNMRMWYEHNEQT